MCNIKIIGYLGDLCNIPAIFVSLKLIQSKNFLKNRKIMVKYRHFQKNES